MIPEIGHYALILALSLAFIQAIMPMWGTFNHNANWVYSAKYTAYGQFLFVLISFLILAYSLVSNDFSVAYVAQNSNTNLPVIYRFCATWGAHEGSLLLWVLILNFWAVLISRLSGQLSPIIMARVLSILAWISIGFLLFLLMTSNPFSRLLPEVPLQGRDLNPLLQDPGLILHPPILYMGYVGFSVAFAFAITALISGKFDASWIKWTRSWSLIAWSFLTLGITLGSWWAYRVLGWGGWWFWDPVENASFLPWLSGTALIHSLLVAEKRQTFKAWTILLAISTFSLSLIGTFLVRSGVLISVHAFARDPARGAFILYFLTLVIGGSLALYGVRGHTIQNSGVFQLWSKETLLLSNNVLLVSCMLTVLLGTLYPLIIDALGLGKLSVGPPYFNAVFIPLMIPALFLMAIAPAVRWQDAKIVLLINHFKYTLLISLVLAFLLPVLLTKELHLTVVIGLLLAFWIIIATLQQTLQQPSPVLKNIKLRLSMILAHIGVAICVVGIVLSSAYSVEKDIRMQPHDQVQVGPYGVQFVKIYNFTGPNFTGYKGQFLISQANHTPVILEPQLRTFNVQKMSLPKAAIQIKPFSDLYLALGEPLEHEAWSLRIYYKPFVRWIWAGGIIMMLGGLVAAIQSRRNLGDVK